MLHSFSCCSSRHSSRLPKRSQVQSRPITFSWLLTCKATVHKWSWGKPQRSRVQTQFLKCSIRKIIWGTGPLKPRTTSNPSRAPPSTRPQWARSQASSTNRWLSCSKTDKFGGCTRKRTRKITWDWNRYTIWTLLWTAYNRTSWANSNSTILLWFTLKLMTLITSHSHRPASRVSMLFMVNEVLRASQAITSSNLLTVKSWQSQPFAWVAHRSSSTWS